MQSPSRPLYVPFRPSPTFRLRRGLTVLLAVLVNAFLHAPFTLVADPPSPSSPSFRPLPRADGLWYDSMRAELRATLRIRARTRPSF